MTGKREALCMAQRTLVARTCSTCGELKMGSEFSLHRQGKFVVWSPDCRACAMIRHRRHQDPSVQTATNTRQLWSQDEDDLVLGDDPLDDIALVLGRTYNAVVNRRWHLRKSLQETS